MQAILLNEEQSSVVTQSREPVQVCDPAGNPLGQVVTGSTASRTVDTDLWVECWKEWYFETQDLEDSASLATIPTPPGGAVKQASRT
jgi:hypothetical protein